MRNFKTANWGYIRFNRKLRNLLIFIYNYLTMKEVTMNNEKEPKLTTRKMIILIAMNLIVVMLNILNLCTKFCKLYEVKHYDEH